jgi:C4-dicarboxylate-specific signal transduction histidine kinase
MRPKKRDDSLNETGEELPPSITLVESYPDHNVWILANNISVELVIQNLVRNAAEAMNGNGTIKITITASYNSVELIITDNGPGIADCRKEDLFEIFKTTKTDEPGMGLGLFLSRHLLQMQNADIYWDDKYKKGAKFVVTFKRYHH